jgi:hypothetical protein
MGLNMGKPPLLQSTDPKLIATARVFVVFDKMTGEILHVHHSLDFGAGALARETPQARALRLAGRRPGGNAETVEVDPTDVLHWGKMRFDIASGKIVRI